ncbi:hypothetical protein Tco_0833384 [Tanacetum coccineum]
MNLFLSLDKSTTVAPIGDETYLLVTKLSMALKDGILDGTYWTWAMAKDTSGWMSFSKRSDNAPVCYMKPIDSLKNWNDYFFWVDEFACPAPFPWHTARYVTRDPAMVAADFNVQDYATLFAHPSPFWKFPEEFMCLIRLSHHYTLDEETYPQFLHKNREDPTKVKVVEWERIKDEPPFLETTVGHTVPLLPVAPDRAESELEASVDRLFDEGGSGNQTEQGHSTGGGRGTDIQPVSEVVDTAVEDVAPVQPKRKRKRKTVVVDAGESSHPPKRLREDHGTLSVASVDGKSMSAVQRLLAKAVRNADVRGEAILTLPFMTSFVSAMPEREGGDHTDFVAEVDSLVRSSIPVMIAVTTVTSTVDPALVVKEKPVKPSFEFPVGVLEHDTTGSRLNDGRVCHEMVDDFDPPKFFAFVRGMEHDQLFTEFNVGAARQMSLSAKVRMRAEYNVKERRRLKSVVKKQDELLKVREEEIESLKAQLSLREAEAAESIRLHVEASKFKIVEKYLWDEVNILKEHNTILEKEQNALDVKVTDLEASAVGKERKLTDLNAQITSVKSQNDNLMDRVHKLEVSSFGLQEKVTVYENYGFWTWMELAITKCLNSPKYLSALGAAIGKAIEKGMQEWLSAGITHGKEGMLVLKCVEHHFTLEESFADKFSRSNMLLQPNDGTSDWSNIYHLPDKVVIAATTLSLALDVSSIYVRKIKENISNQRSVMHDVFVPLSEPLSAAVLTGTEGTSDTVPAYADTTTALSTTFASASTIAPISVDDYEVEGTDDQADADVNTDENIASFLNVDDADLNIPW